MVSRCLFQLNCIRSFASKNLQKEIARIRLIHKDSSTLLIQHIVKQPKLSAGIKEEIRKVFISSEKEIPQSMLAQPDAFLKHLDTSFESFFYQREYTNENINLYMKMLGVQQRVDLLPGALERFKVIL